MKPFGLLITFFLFTAFFAFAQPETGKKAKIFAGFPIVPKPETAMVAPKPLSNNPFLDIDPAKNSEPLFTPNTNIFQDKKKPSFVIGEKRNNILDPKPVFANPNLDVLDKLNQKLPKPVSENFNALKGDKEFCNIKTKSDYLYVIYRDFGEVDGDQFRILMNGNDLTGFITLESNYKEVKIKLEDGFNKIDFEIMNVGLISPNTAEFQFSTSPGVIICQDSWALLTGFKAIVRVFKE